MCWAAGGSQPALRGPGEFGFQREGEARRVPFPDLEGFGGELERRLPALGGALLGVSVSDGEGGAQVDVVIPGSAAEQAGVEAGDVITAVDGVETPEAAALLETVRAHEPGDELTLRVERGDEELELAVTLGQRRLSTALPGTTEPPTPPAET